MAPVPVPAKGLYQLDVDDVIWQDLGLEDEEGTPPLWLCDDNVRSGIRAVLQKDRCNEEAPRCCGRGSICKFGLPPSGRQWRKRTRSVLVS